VVAEVEDLVIGLAVVQRAEDAAHGVGYDGVIASGGPIPEEGNRLTGQDHFRKLMDGQIGPLSRTEYREKAQSDESDAVQVAVHVTHEFASQFGGRVRTDRSQIGLVFRPRHIRAVAIHAARRGEHELTDAVRLGEIEEGLGPHHVHINIPGRPLDRRAHTCQSCEMHDRIDSELGERLDRIRIADIPFHQGEVGMLQRLLDIPQFHIPTIERVEVVERDHPMSDCQQGIAQMATDEPGASRNKDATFTHISHISHISHNPACQQAVHTSLEDTQTASQESQAWRWNRIRRIRFLQDIADLAADQVFGLGHEAVEFGDVHIRADDAHVEDIGVES
jgi:hypothetical protein